MVSEYSQFSSGSVQLRREKQFNKIGCFENENKGHHSKNVPVEEPSHEIPTFFVFTKSAHQNLLLISLTKKCDLLDMLNKRIISSGYESYYNNMTVSKGIKDTATWGQNENEDEEAEDNNLP